MALRDINLIPADILTRRFVRRHVYFWTACLIFSLSFIGIATLCYTQTYLASKKSALDAMRNAPLNLNAKAEEIRQMKTEINYLNKRQAARQFIITHNPSSSAVITKLTEIMNEDTWLMQVTLDTGPGKEGRTNLKLTGFSFSNEKLGDFLNRLASDPLFKGVELKYSREGGQVSAGQSGGHTDKLIQYQIDCFISKDNRG